MSVSAVPSTRPAVPVAPRPPGPNRIVPFKRPSPHRVVPFKRPPIPKTNPPTPKKVPGIPFSTLSFVDPEIAAELGLNSPPGPAEDRAPRQNPIPADFQGGQCEGAYYRVRITRRNVDSLCRESDILGPAQQFVYGPILYIGPRDIGVRCGKNLAKKLVCEAFDEDGNFKEYRFIKSGGLTQEFISVVDITRLDGFPDNCGDPPPVGYEELPPLNWPFQGAPKLEVEAPPKPETTPVPDTVPQFPGEEPEIPPGETEIVPFKRPNREIPEPDQPDPLPDERPEPPPEETPPSEPDQPDPLPDYDPEPPTIPQRPPNEDPNKEPETDRPTLPPLPQPQKPGFNPDFDPNRDPAPAPTTPEKPVTDPPEIEPGKYPDAEPGKYPDAEPIPGSPSPIGPRIPDRPTIPTTPGTLPPGIPPTPQTPTETPPETPPETPNTPNQPPPFNPPIAPPAKPPINPGNPVVPNPPKSPPKSPPKVPGTGLQPPPYSPPYSPPEKPERECTCSPALEPEEEVMVVKFTNVRVRVVSCQLTPLGWQAYSTYKNVPVLVGENGSEAQQVIESFEAKARIATEQCVAKNNFAELLGLGGDAGLAALLQQIANAIGVSGFPATVPGNLANPNAGTRQLNSLAEMHLWQTEQIDGLVGQFPQKTKVTTDGREIDLESPNISETLAEIQGMLISLMISNSEILHTSTRTLHQAGSATQQAHLANLIARGNAEFLGYEARATETTIPMAYTPGKSPFEGLLVESEQKIRGWTNSDGQDLKAIFAELLQAAAIIRAVYWRRLSTDGDFTQQLKDNIDGKGQFVDEQGQRGDSDWEQYLQDVEQGFSEDGTPYDRPADQAPKIRDRSPGEGE